jgi:hypothetical protein
MAARHRDRRRAAHYPAADDAVLCLDPYVGVWVVFRECAGPGAYRAFDDMAAELFPIPATGSIDEDLRLFGRLLVDWLTNDSPTVAGLQRAGQGFTVTSHLVFCVISSFTSVASWATMRHGVVYWAGADS